MLHNLAEKHVANAQISWLRKFKYRSKRKIGTEVNMYMRLGKGPVSCVHRREAALKLDLEVKLLWKISNKAHQDYRKQPTLSRLTAIMQKCHINSQTRIYLKVHRLLRPAVALFIRITHLYCSPPHMNEGFAHSQFSLTIYWRQTAAKKKLIPKHFYEHFLSGLSLLWLLCLHF